MGMASGTVRRLVLGQAWVFMQRNSGALVIRTREVSFVSRELTTCNNEHGTYHYHLPKVLRTSWVI